MLVFAAEPGFPLVDQRKHEPGRCAPTPIEPAVDVDYHQPAGHRIIDLPLMCADLLRQLLVWRVVSLENPATRIRLFALVEMPADCRREIGAIGTVDDAPAPRRRARSSRH